MTRWVLGVVLVVATAVTGWLVGGLPGFQSASVAGLLGFGAHAWASTWLRRRKDAEFKKLAGAMLGGMAIRFGGVGLVVGLVAWNDTMFPPATTMIGYVAVLVPLLFIEIRFLK